MKKILLGIALALSAFVFISCNNVYQIENVNSTKYADNYYSASGTIKIKNNVECTYKDELMKDYNYKDVTNTEYTVYDSPADTIITHNIGTNSNYDEWWYISSVPYNKKITKVNEEDATITDGIGSYYLGINIYKYGDRYKTVFNGKEVDLNFVEDGDVITLTGTYTTYSVDSETEYINYTSKSESTYSLTFTKK